METIRNGRFVIEKLKSNGHEAYYVGGCVRDHLLGLEIRDIDITTSAKPFEVLKLFKSEPTGLKYGTITVLHEKVNIEVTTYRVDGTYEDFRKPTEVTLTDSKEEDVKRRDFTINGLLMDENYEITDYVGGQEDLQNHIIRAIGNPVERFNEDALRLLRAVYFQTKLGFQIDKDTRDAMKENAHLITHLPNERVLNETLKILSGDYQLMGLKTIETTGLSKYLPGLEKGINFINENLKDRIFIDSFFVLCFSLHGSVPNDWKFSNVHRNKYQKSVELVLKNPEIDALILYNYGLEISLLANKILFILGKQKNQKNQIKTLFEALPINSVTDLKVKGSDILSLTEKKQGAWLSKLLDELVTKVLKKELVNTYEDLMNYCRGILNEK
ncbi:MAG: CCA tRNA nucleotidyltransferase [Acholeplasmataceae bacterium]|nr:CCA tRNA nucleotidyltransferase [Acholeplasmataceae bacterium]